MKHGVYNVLIRPIVTEKGTHQSQTRNAYAFEVAVGSTKAQVKQAIETVYKVKVLKVRTANYKGKPRRTGYRWGTTSHWKKAVVELHGDYRIDLF